MSEKYTIIIDGDQARWLRLMYSQIEQDYSKGKPTMFYSADVNRFEEITKQAEQEPKNEVDMRKQYYDEKVDKLEVRLDKLEEFVNDLIEWQLQSLERKVKLDEEILKRRKGVTFSDSKI